MTAYSWILRQTLADQTKLVGHLFEIESVFESPKHENILLYKIVSSGEIFSDECEYTSKLHKLKHNLKNLEDELTELLKSKIKAKAVSYQSDFRTEISEKTEQIARAEKSVSEFEAVTTHKIENCSWYLIANEELYSTLGSLKFPVFEYAKQMWWGMPEPLPASLESIIANLKDLVLINNAKNADIANYLCKKLKTGFGNYLDHQDERNVVPYWRQETIEEELFGDSKRSSGYAVNSDNNSPNFHAQSEDTPLGDPLDDFRPAWDKLKTTEDLEKMYDTQHGFGASGANE